MEFIYFQDFYYEPTSGCQPSDVNNVKRIELNWKLWATKILPKVDSAAFVKRLEERQLTSLIVSLGWLLINKHFDFKENLNQATLYDTKSTWSHFPIWIGANIKITVICQRLSFQET